MLCRVIAECVVGHRDALVDVEVDTDARHRRHVGRKRAASDLVAEGRGKQRAKDCCKRAEPSAAGLATFLVWWLALPAELAVIPMKAEYGAGRLAHGSRPDCTHRC